MSERRRSLFFNKKFRRRGRQVAGLLLDLRDSVYLGLWCLLVHLFIEPVLGDMRGGEEG